MSFFSRIKKIFNSSSAASARGKEPSPPRGDTPPRVEKAKPPRRSRAQGEVWRAGSGEPPAPRPAVPSERKNASRRGDSRRGGSSRRDRGRGRREEQSGEPAFRDRTPSERAAAIAAHEAWDPASWQVAPSPARPRVLDFPLPSPLRHALSDLDFRYCTPIQERAIPLALDGNDIAGRAQTGTGKTAAFLLAVFARFLENPPPANRRKARPRALVMAPTRELAMQIAEDAEALAKYTPIRIVPLYGGMDMPAQRAALRERAVDLVVATPGRLLDLRQRQEVDLDDVEILVIDEADRMLDMGFIPDMGRIIYACPPRNRRQTMLFSATLDAPVMRLAEKWMRKPEIVNIEPERVAAETIDQRVYIATADQKFTIVCNLLRQLEPHRTIIFGNRRDSTDRLCENLRHQGFSTELLSGAVDQKRRVRVLEDFKEGKVPVLVATDVAGRGLHIDDVELIVNFNIPDQAEDYVHRIGRTGRVGKKGTSVTFADELDSYRIPDIEEYMHQPLVCVPPPEGSLFPFSSHPSGVLGLIYLYATTCSTSSMDQLSVQT
ncbi:MAG: DEAD/DEAH box helicase [Kiritimatiellae bacterium]|nr:DEAD/DEAH box helicase [Kiritimatiellia bacterium]